MTESATAADVSAPAAPDHAADAAGTADPSGPVETGSDSDPASVTAATTDGHPSSPHPAPTTLLGDREVDIVQSAEGRRHNPLRDPADRRLPRVPEPCALVVFGVTGDLSRKKLLPAIYDLANRGLLPTDFVLLGFARRDWEDGDFEDLAKKSAKEHARTDWNEEVWARLSGNIKFVPGAFDDDDAFDELAQTLDDLRESHGIKGNAAFYLSIPPTMFPTVLKQMERTGMADNDEVRWLAPGRGREAVRARPAQRAGAEPAGRLGVHAPMTCSGSTTTWARRPSRTSWRCGSPTSCSSRSGTPTTSTRCRSRWPRTSASAGGRRSTTPPAPPATCCRTTCCSCSR